MGPDGKFQTHIIQFDNQEAASSTTTHAPTQPTTVTPIVVKHEAKAVAPQAAVAAAAAAPALEVAAKTPVASPVVVKDGPAEKDKELVAPAVSSIPTPIPV